MTAWKSTMGAPLSEDEAMSIDHAWADLRRHCDDIDFILPEPEPVGMLNYISEMILKCYEVRTRINEAWFQANKRAFPGPAPKPKSELRRTSELLDALGLLTKEEIEQVYKSVTGGGKDL